MTGEDLYNEYVDLNRLCGVEIDEGWDDLSDRDREIWDALAQWAEKNANG